MSDELKNKLKNNLYEKRYIHSLGVAEEAKRLAVIYGADEEKAYIAGLLHDCAKKFTPDEQLDVCKKIGVELDEYAKLCIPIVHSFLGVEIARTEYGINDVEILNAIKYHTVGRAGMTLLEKIIYIADITEAGRDFEGVDELRRLVDKDLTAAIIKSVEFELKRNSQRQSIIHPNMIYMWNDIVLNRD